jgi:hypothetical protein
MLAGTDTPCYRPLTASRTKSGITGRARSDLRKAAAISSIENWAVVNGAALAEPFSPHSKTGNLMFTLVAADPPVEVPLGSAGEG